MLRDLDNVPRRLLGASAGSEPSLTSQVDVAMVCGVSAVPRSRAASRPICRASISVLPHSRRPARPVDGLTDTRPRRMARAGRVGELRLTSCSGEAKVARGSAVTVRRATRRSTRAGVALVGARTGVTARVIGGHCARREEGRGLGRSGDGAHESAKRGEKEQGMHVGFGCVGRCNGESFGCSRKDGC